MHRAAVGFGLGNFDRLAGEQVFDGVADVVFCLARVAIGTRVVVHRAAVGERAVLADDENVRGSFHAVEAAKVTGAVVKPRGRGELQLFPFCLRLCGVAVTGIFRADGIHEQPDDAFAGEFFLKLLRRALIVVVVERAVRVEGFEDDNLAFVVGELDGDRKSVV